MKTAKDILSGVRHMTWRFGANSSFPVLIARHVARLIAPDDVDSLNVVAPNQLGDSAFDLRCEIGGVHFADGSVSDADGKPVRDAGAG